jgi:hypothetical protein
MKTVILAIALSFGMTLQAECKTQYRIHIRPTNGQAEYWQNGVQYVDDMKSVSVVKIVGSHDTLPDKQSTFEIYVFNRSNQPVTFGLEDIVIESSSGERIQMTTYDELAGRLRRDVKRRQTAAMIGKAFSANAANGYTTGSFDYNGTTAYGTPISGSGSYSRYDPALARQQQQAVRDQASAVSSAIQARLTGGSDALDGLLQRSTIQPGGKISGTVAYDAPPSFKRLSNSIPITIIINVGGQEHRIAADILETR